VGFNQLIFGAKNTILTASLRAFEKEIFSLIEVSSYMHQNGFTVFCQNKVFGDSI